MNSRRTQGPIGFLRGGCLFFFSCFLFFSCHKGEVFIDDSSSEVRANIPVFNVDSNFVADEAYKGYNAAFLLKTEGLMFYRTALNNNEKDYFWCQALDIQMVQDAYLRTKSSFHKTTMNNLLMTFNKQNSTNVRLGDWTWNEFNDDLLWAMLIYLRGYQYTDNEDFLRQAKWAFDFMYQRGCDSTLGGGIWWSTKKENKSPLSNSPAVLSACYLYEFTNDPSYLTKAIELYEWERKTIYNSSTGEVWGDVLAGGTINKAVSVFNNGAFAAAANYLHRLTGVDAYYDDAKRTFDWVRTNMTYNGLLHAGTRTGTDLAEYIRYLSDFVRENNLWTTYYPWMKKNADAAWKIRRTDLNIAWNDWTKQTPTDLVASAIECSSAAVMQQVTPRTQPGLLEKVNYRFVAKLDSSSALTVTDSTTLEGQVVHVTKNESTNNQIFNIILIGRGYYRLVPLNAPDKSLTVTEADKDHVFSVAMANSQDSPNQYWNIIYDYDGFYKFKPKSAPSYCLYLSNTKDLPRTVLRRECQKDNERWFIRPVTTK